MSLIDFEYTKKYATEWLITHEWGSLVGLNGIGLTYGEDEEGEYVVLGFALPEGWFAEIEDGTYGELQGFRIYRKDLP